MANDKPRSAQAASHSNFIRQIVEADLARGKYAARRWAGKPASAHAHKEAAPDLAKIRTRFPPEPNGYLHFGHAKAICLNFGLAAEYGGACHLRFDDTNPTKEEQEYVDAIRDAVRWLGFSWENEGALHEYYASDYFEYLYQFAEELIRRGLAYVDSLSAEQVRSLRGTLTEPGKESPYRDRGVAENLALLREMRMGKFRDGEHVLRARIDMASPNMNLRDPATAPATPGASTRPTTGLTACRTRWKTSRTRSARSNSRTTGRCTTGSTSASPRPACCRCRCRSRSSSRAST
jgi:glutaminyl-tRNA synthetase